MNKDTLLEEVRKVELALNLAERYDDIDYYLADSVWHLIDCINKLDEPQKTIIPQFVADYIEKWEHEGLTIYEWFSFDNNDVDEDVNKWLYDNTMEENRRREHLLVNAIRNGYEVEKEPYYYVAFEGDFNLLYVTHVDIYGENGKFNYSSEFDKKHALKFTDKSRAKYLADFLGAIVLEEQK